MKHLLLIILCIIIMPAFIFNLSAQNTNISGKVTDSEDGAPIPGVNVVAKGTALGATTDLDGNFALEIPQNSTLVFSYIGYETQEVAISGRSVVNVSLTPGLKELNEVVITAFGLEQEKRGLGYAVQEVTAENLENNPVPNALTALQGQVSGVDINTTSGGPGAGVSIIIRGINSLNPNANNQPLFVIDGIPISNDTDGAGPESEGSYSTTNRFSDINPADIASISILKGPAASALYGLRAANGAVIVTTKKGQAGKTVFNFRTSYSFDDVVTLPEVQNIYGQGNGGIYSEGATNRSYGPPIVPGDGLQAYDNYDRFFKTGHKWQNSFDMSGGNETATYYSSFSRVDQSGVTPNSDYERTTIKFSGSLKATEFLDLQASASYINSGSTNPSGGNFRGYLSDLNSFPVSVDIKQYEDENGNQIRPNYDLIDNPIWSTAKIYAEDNTDRFIGNFGFNLHPLDWLSIDYKVGIDQYGSTIEEVISPDTRLGVSGGGLVQRNIHYREVNSNLIMTGSYEINDDFKGSVLVGHNYTSIKKDIQSTSGSRFVLDDFININNLTTYTASQSFGDRNIIGVFADARLSWRNTLYLGVTARNDWSSTLPASNRSFFYPSVSLAYVFSETLGLSDNPILDYGKLRLSYAEVGKDASPYNIGSYFSSVNAFDGQAGNRLSETFGSENLKPEKDVGYEVGLNLSFLQGRIDLDANYALQYARDQIVPIPISFSTGYSTFVTNAGEIKNTSFEFLLKADVLKPNPNFNWALTVNFSRIRADVVSTPEGIDEFTFNPASPWVKNIIKKGGSAGDLYGWPMTRVDDPSSPYNGRLVIGTNGFPVAINQGLALGENFLVGNAFPDWTMGAGSTFTWKGISLNFLFDFRKGGSVFDINARNRLNNGIAASTSRRHIQVIYDGVVNTGTAENPQYIENTQAVELGGHDSYYLGDGGSLATLAVENNGFQEDISWIRLRSLRLGYDLPQSLLSKFFITRANVYVAGNNLWLSTKARGFDPEGSIYGSGSNSFGYIGTNTPQARSIFMGLNISF